MKQYGRVTLATNVEDEEAIPVLKGEITMGVNDRMTMEMTIIRVSIEAKMAQIGLTVWEDTHGTS